jgi:SSS family solute:Na+ symporter
MGQHVQNMQTVDLVIIGFYILIVVIIGMLRGRKLRSDTDFFLAGRKLRWPNIGFSIFASNISAEHLVGLAGAGYMFGLLHGNYEWMASGSLLLLALVFAPYYLSTKVSTMPEFLERRYSRKCRDFLSWLNVITIIFIRLGVGLYAGGLVIHVFLGWKLETCIVLIAVIAASYTIVGGLAAIVMTDTFQAVIMILGSIALVFIGLDKVGGIGALTAKVPSEYWSMLRPASDPEMPWYAIVFGYPVLGIWYWCTDQLMVQRVLGARDINQGQKGILFASFLKILPVFIFVLPGTILFALNPGLANGDHAYTLMISQWLPVGIRGIMVAVLIAALLSTIDSGLNAISALFTLDIFRKWMPDASHAKLLVIGRIATAVSMLIAILWSPIIGRFPKGIFIALNQLISCIAPPLTALFLLGVLYKKTTPRAAELALWVGSPICAALGIAQALNWPENFWPGRLNFMFLAFLMLIGVMLFMVIVSAFTKPTEPEKRLPSLGEITKHAHSRTVYVLSIVLAVVMITLYIIFK